MISPSELRDRPVFICGHPKSGTSLVRAILDSHPQLVVYPEETVFFRRFLPKAEGLDRQGQLELAEQSLIHIFTWNRENPPFSQAGFPDRDYSKISFQSIRRQMRDLIESNHRHEGDFLSAAILAFGQVSGQTNSDTRYWVEKSPYNEYFAQKIFAWWPQARCIHILRDPRDNFASYRRKHPDWSAEFFSANWNRSTGTGIRNQELYGNQHYLILRYEDLVQSPQESLGYLTEFLEIDWSDSLVSPTRAGEVWKGNSMFTDRFQGISVVPVTRWKESLSPLDATTIELMTRGHLHIFQYPHQPLAYPMAGKRISPSQALAVRWRVATWPIRRRLSRPHLTSSSLSEINKSGESVDDDPTEE